MKVIRVAVCTYNRAPQLERTLRAICEQQVPSGWRVEILVVDNDVAQTARLIADEFRRLQSRDIIYLNEPLAGLGRARNRALEASGEYSALVFFDDDQVPVRGWLAAFVARHEQNRPAILCGPVSPRLPEQLPAWASSGWPWRRATHVDDEALEVCGDGNLLVPADIISDGRFRYSPQFLVGMGQDAELTLRMTQLGVPIRYVLEAAAVEDLPSERISRDWVLDRCRKSACGWARAELAQSRRRLIAIVLSAARQTLLSLRLNPFSRGSEEEVLLRRAARARLVGYRDAIREL